MKIAFEGGMVWNMSSTWICTVAAAS